MKMILHNNELVQFDIREMRWNLFPAIFRDFPNITQSHLTIENLTKQMFSVKNI